jgi:hypothetical protein
LSFSHQEDLRLEPIHEDLTEKREEKVRAEDDVKEGERRLTGSSKSE